jgi:D-arabinonate dehydratase
VKITDIRPAFISKQRVTPRTNGKYTYRFTNVVFAFVDTDEGVSGFGWVGGGDRGSQMICQAISEMRDYVVGIDPFCVDQVWAKLYLPKVFGRKGLSTRAISAIDIALWDVKGKATGKPVHKLLGGNLERVPAYIAGGYYADGKTLKDLASEMEAYLKMNARAVKMKVGAVPIRQDIERVRVVRETIGPDISLLVDANNAYWPHEAVRFARAVEKYDPFWFEEPVSPDDIPGQATVAAATTIPIAIGENEYTRWGFRDLIDNKCADVLNADAQVLGGITEWKRVANLAAAYDIPVAPHGNQDVHVHCVASAPNSLILECGQLDPKEPILLDEIFTNRQRLGKDGLCPVPQTPGMGIELDMKAFEKYRAG